MSKLISGANISNYPKPHGSGTTGSSTVIYKGGGGGGNDSSFDPSNCRVTKLTANIASIDSITAKNANINNASILYLMSTEGQIAKISGEELNYNYGTINHLTSDEVTTNALTVKDSATIAKLIADYIQSNEITTDYLTVTKSAHFFELIIDKIRSVQGTQMNTAANCTIDYVEAYNSNNVKVNITSENIAYFRVYWKNTDDDGKSISNDWLPLDQAICESFNVNTGVSYDVSNKYYWRKVTATDGGTPKYVNLNTQEVRNSAPANYTITFNSSYLFCYGDRSTENNYQAFTVTSQVLNEYNATSYTWTPSSTLYGLQITPTDQNAMLMNNSFSFHTTAKTKLNIGVYYGDNSFEYFPASNYATEYSITTQENKPVEAFVITTAVIDTWSACNWIDLSNTVMDATKAGKSAIPSAGDVLCQLGYRYTELSGYENTDAWRTAHRDEVSRASAIIIAAYETPDNGDAEHGIPAVFPPSYAQYQNIIDFNLTSHRGTYFDATGAYFKGNLVAGTTVDEGVDLPITVDQWSFVGSPIIIRNDNGTFTPSTITLKILYTSGSSSIIYNSIPSGTHLYVNGAQVNTLTIASANMLNVELKDNDGKTLCATVINASDINILADVHDGVDGDFYEWIYQKAGIDEELVNADLPQSLEKKFYLYTTTEKRSWSQTPPTIDPESENLWMSQRFVRNTVIESPIIIVDKERIVYQTTPNNSVTATVRVTGSNLTSNVTVTLTNQSNVFRVSSNSLDYEDVNDEGVTLTVTFAPTTTGNYEGSISLSSTGSNTISIPLTGKSSTGDNASNNYLNVKNNNTISTVGWDATKVDNLYAYSEIPDTGIAWLTMPVYGAFSALHENYTQNWLSTDVSVDTSTSITTGGWQPMADNVFLGSAYYFTNTTAKSVGAQALLSATGTTVSFTVTNITAARLLGYNRDNASSTNPMTMSVYECTVSGGTVTPSSTPIYNPHGTNPNPNELVYLYIDNLDPNKVYKIECHENRGTLYEVAFSTPITKIADAESPSGRDVVTTWGAWSTPIQVNGENGENGADGPGVEFIYHLTRDNLPAPNLWQYRNQITNYSSLSSSYIGYDASDNNRISWWQEDNNSPIHNSSYVDYIPPSYTYSYQGLNYLRTGWTDDPQGVNSSYMYEWVSQRKSRDGVWGDFSTPVVWAKWGENGVDGVDGINGIDGIDGENAEEWKLIPVKKTFEVNINKDVANNYESITGVIKTDLAFAVLHIDGETATYLTYNELGSYNLKLLTNNTTGNKSQNLGSNRATVTLADGTSLACLVYDNSNYLTYTSGQSSGDYTDYYYLHKNNLTSRMPTQMIVKLMKGSSQMDAATLDLIFAPDHILSVTDDALNSVYQGLSGDTLGSFTTGFSAIRQQWDGINLNVSNIQNISNGSWPQNTEYEQYAFYRNNANTAPSAPSGNVTETRTTVNSTWTLGHITPSASYKYVWYTKRTKPATSYQHATDNWSTWGTVTLFQMYGSDRGYINSAALNIKADSITSYVNQTYQSKTDATNSYNSLDSRITQTADRITSTVTELHSDYSTTDETQSMIDQSANSISLQINQVSKSIGGAGVNYLYDADLINASVLNTGIPGTTLNKWINGSSSAISWNGNVKFDDYATIDINMSAGTWNTVHQCIDYQSLNQLTTDDKVCVSCMVKASNVMSGNDTKFGISLYMADTSSTLYAYIDSAYFVQSDGSIYSWNTTHTNSAREWGEIRVDNTHWNDTNWHKMYIVFHRTDTSQSLTPLRIAFYGHRTSSSSSIHLYMTQPKLELGSVPTSFDNDNDKINVMKRTGIDITNGKIILEADNTDIVSNLNIYQADAAGFTMYDNNSNPQINMTATNINKTFDDYIKDFVTYDALSRADNKKPAGTGSVTIPIAQIPIGSVTSGQVLTFPVSSNTTQLDQFINYLVPFFSVTLDGGGIPYITQITYATLTLQLMLGASTYQVWTGSATVKYISGSYYILIPSDITYTIPSSNSNAILTGNISLSLNGTLKSNAYYAALRSIFTFTKSDAPTNRIALDGTIISPSVKNINWFGKDVTAFTNGSNQLLIKNNGIFEKHLGTSLTSYSESPIGHYQNILYISSSITIPADVTCAIIGNNNEQLTVSLPNIDDSNTLHGHTIYVKNNSSRDHKISVSGQTKIVPSGTNYSSGQTQSYTIAQGRTMIFILQHDIDYPSGVWFQW